MNRTYSDICKSLLPTLCLLVLKYTLFFSYKVIQEFNIQADKQRIFTVTALPSRHYSSDLHQLHVSLLFHVDEIAFQHLAFCQIASALGQLHYWNKDRKWKYWKVLWMELLEWTLERKKKTQTAKQRLKCLWPHFQEVCHLFPNKQRVLATKETELVNSRVVTWLIFHQMAISEIVYKTLLTR